MEFLKNENDHNFCKSCLEKTKKVVFKKIKSFIFSKHGFSIFNSTFPKVLQKFRILVIYFIILTFCKYLGLHFNFLQIFRSSTQKTKGNPFY